ncbi:glycosyltransferase family 9 protein [Halorhodospira halophila]|uniref:Glycosyl transferase, family 9 n=1 Tax=Halorhodospira halophila (strain DSM 244 / SL1) TaxID=349124 RepID=A1WZB2_HALHL|nr:glycosyltransferase family 9 protein [Halorhodospira halophila]ABM63024.1 glycosyl transferase, family 9 [Halorhodospira halophila SL1]MBK1727855.1 glycosyl transferase [Halorhodospira halophila]
MPRDPSTPPDSVCLLRLSAIGDCSHVVPVVQTLRQHWPETAITWVIGKTEYRLFGDLPGVEFIVVDKGDGLFGAVPKLRRDLADRRFDLLLHMQASWRANLLSTAIRADTRIGFDRPRARNGQRWFTHRAIAGPARVHVLDGFFQFLEAAGLQARTLRWDLPVPAEAEAEVAGRLPDQPFLTISPCSSIRARNYRNWSASQYAAVAEYAYQEHGLALVLTGGPTALEREYADAITALTSAPVVDLVGATSLKGLLAVLQRASAFVGPDSGPLHLANASGVPVVGLYATSNPQRTGPYLNLDYVANRYPEALKAELGQPVEAVRWGRRVRDPEAMDWITVADVAARLDAALADRGASGRSAAAGS